MTELSGFTAAQPLAQIGPQSLRLPSSMAEVCDCDSGCGASQILQGLAQIVASGLTDRIDIKVQAVTTTERVRVLVIPWKKDGVADNGAAPPGGWVAVDGTEVVGMGNSEYASRWTNNLPLKWDGTVAAELIDGGRVKLTFPQPTSANRPFTYSVTSDGQDVPLVGSPVVHDGQNEIVSGVPVPTGAVVDVTIDAGLTQPGQSAAYCVHVATQYQGVSGQSPESNTVTVPEQEPEGDPPA